MQPCVQWDIGMARMFHAVALKTYRLPLMEYVIFRFFLGSEYYHPCSDCVLALYFLHKRFWREFTMVWRLGPGAGGLLWYFLSHYFGRPRPPTQIDIVLSPIHLSRVDTTLSAIGVLWSAGISSGSQNAIPFLEVVRCDPPNVCHRVYWLQPTDAGWTLCHGRRSQDMARHCLGRTCVHRCGRYSSRRYEVRNSRCFRVHQAYYSEGLAVLRGLFGNGRSWGLV